MASKKKKEIPSVFEILDRKRNEEIAQMSKGSKSTQKFLNQTLAPSSKSQIASGIIKTSNPTTLSYGNQEGYVAQRILAPLPSAPTTSTDLFNKLKTENEQRTKEQEEKRIKELEEQVKNERQEIGAVSEEELKELKKSVLLQGKSYDKNKQSISFYKKPEETDFEAMQRIEKDSSKYDKTSKAYKELQELYKHKEEREKKERKARQANKKGYLNAGAFSDGYDFGDVTKTILGTAADLGSDLYKGVLQAGEGLGKLTAAGVAELAGVFGDEETEKRIKKNIATKDGNFVSEGFDSLFKWTEEPSVLGQESDEFANSAGTSLAAAAAQTVGIPWQLVAGGSSAGNELQNAYREGATDSEAWLSAGISGATEIVFEKLGGIKFGGKALDSGLKKTISKKFGNNIVKNGLLLGLDLNTEGTEEVLTSIAQNIGRKLTYEDNKTWKDILASDEAIDEYVRSYISGALLGGMFNAGKVVSTNITGRNYDTGLTQNEQTVIDNIVESRVEELKKSKDKVTKKDVSKIEQEVRQDLERGYIETSEIERALSNEEWAKHDKVVKQKEKLENKIKELESKTPQDYKTMGELNSSNEELSRLKEQLSSIDTDTTRGELNSAMQGKLTENDTLLQNIYGKTISRNKKFETTAKASGIDINDETIKTIKDKMFKRGIEISFDESQFKGTNEDAFWRQNEDGTREVIFNPKADTGMLLQNVAVHEMYHDIFTSKTGRKIAPEVLDFIKTKEGYAEARAEVEKIYAKDYENTNSEEFTKKIDEEVVAKVLGQKLGDQEYINSLTMEKPSTARAIYNWIVDKLNKFTGSKNEKLFWTDVKNKFETALSEDYVAIDEAITKKHISKNIHKDIDKVLTDINERAPVRLRDYTPAVMVDNGVRNLPMYENPGHIRKNILSKQEAIDLGLKINERDNYHGLGKDLYIKVIDSLDDPRAIFKNKNSGDHIVLTMIKDSDGNNIIVPIEIETTTNINKIKIDTNRIKTVYGYDIKKPNLNEYIKHNIKNNVFEKIYEKKERGTGNSTVASSFNNSIITQNKENVNNRAVTKHSMQKSENNTQELDNSSFSLDKLPKVKEGYTRLYRGLNNDYDVNYDRSTLDSPNGYDTLTDNYELAKQYGKNVYYIDIPTNQIADSVIDENPNSETYGDRHLAYKDDKPAGINGVSGDEYLLYTDHDDFDSNNYHKVEDSNTNDSISNKDSQGRTLTKEQQEYFKDSKVVDENGNLLVMYHGGNSDNTTFDRTKGGLSNSNASVGIWFTPSKEGAKSFVDGIWYGEDTNGKKTGRVLETYLNIINPKIYESYDNTETRNKLKEQLDEKYKQRKELIDKYSWETPSLSAVISYMEYMDENKLINNLVNNAHLKEETAKQYIEDAKKYIEVNKEYKDIERQFDDARWTDSYEQFRTDIYKLAGKTADDANTGGIGMALDNKEQYIEQYVNNLKREGYDGIIIKNTIYDSKDFGEGNNQYVVFDSNQIKNVDNTNPTTNEDIRHSITTDKFQEFLDKNIQRGKGKTMQEVRTQQEQIQKAIAPIQEENKVLKQEVKALQKEVRDIQENNAISYEDFEEYNKRIAPLLEEQEAPPEVEQVYDNLKDTTRMPKKELKLLSKNIKDTLGLTNKQKLDLEEIIQDYSTSETATREDLYNEIKKRYGKQAIITEYEDIRNVQRKIKSMKLDVSDNIRHDIADYNMLRQKNFVKLSFSRNGQPVDSVYQELSSEYPNYFPSNIYNETDQFLKIVDVANLENKSVEELNLDDNYIRETSDYIYESILDSKQDAVKKAVEKISKESLQGELKAPLPVSFDTSDIDANNAVDEVRLMEHKARKKSQVDKGNGKRAPFDWSTFEEVGRKLRAGEDADSIAELNKLDAEAANKQIEEQKKLKPKNESKLKKTKQALQYIVTNENAEIDDYSKLSGNKEIKYSADRVTNIRGLIEKNINENQTDNNGKTIGKGIVQIFNQANDVGLSEAFNDYLFHLSNIERHKWGKGSQVPATDSSILIEEYEKTYPEMKKWAKEVNKYNKNLLYKQADAGLITKELADNLSKMYEFYVPFMENLEGEYTPDKSNTIKTRSTVQRAKGGSSRNLLSFEDAMIKQTQTAISQIAKNKLYQEIVKTKENANIDFESNTNPDIHDNGLFSDNGKYYLTAYVDGKATQVEIDKSLYHGLAKTEKQAIQNLENSIKPLLTPLQKTSAVARKSVTTWSPAFLAKNFVKDLHDGLWNTKYLLQFPKNYIKAHKELLTRKGGVEFEEFMNNYGAENLRGDYTSLNSDFNDGINIKTKSSSKGKTLNIAKSMFKGIARLNENIELAPRLAEYYSSRDAGCSVEESMYNAREITTNFGRGGIVTKALNRNGFNFLNASVQGLSKTVRNLSGENGTRALVGSLARATAFGMAPALINALLLGDDDDYEVIPDYIKDNYILIKVDEEDADKYDNIGNVVKSKGSTYIRIPYGRAMSIFGSAARRTLERAQGKRDDISFGDDLISWGKNAWNQIGVTDMGSSFITAPITQAKNNKTWYGTDLVPKRLQKDKDGKLIPPEQQYDASTDKFSVFLGQKLGVSPYKINYVIDQYSGGIGDIILPTITPEAQSNTNSTVGMMIAPIKDQFVVDSVTDNKYVTKFYSKTDELGEQLNRTKSKKDEMSYNYMRNISFEMGALYSEMREVQEDNKLTRKQKYAKVQNIKAEINRLAEEGMKGYKDVETYDNYARVGDRELYKYQSKDGKTGWSDSSGMYADDINSLGLSIKEKDTYYTTKMEMSNVANKFKEDEGAEKYRAVLKTIRNSKLPSDAKYELYNSWYGKSDETSSIVQGLGISANDYLKFKTADLSSTKNKNGYAVRGSKADKVISYLNKTNLSKGQKAVLYRLAFNYKGNYSSSKYSNAYNEEIVNYIDNSSLTYDESIDALKKLGFKVSKDGTVKWD